MLQGAIIGLIVGLGMAVVFYFIAKGKKASFDLPVVRTETFSAGLAPGAVIAKVTEAAASMGLKVALTDGDANRLILEDGVSFNSYGSFLKVSAVGEGGGSAVTVDLMNKAPQWGPVVTKKHRALAAKVKTALGVA